MRALAAILLLAACGDSGGAVAPDAAGADAHIVRTARFDVSWIPRGAYDGFADCPTGSSAVFYAQRAEDPAPSVDRFDCTSYEGLSTMLPQGDYTIWLEVTDPTGATLYARTPPFTQVTLRDGNVTPAEFDVNVTSGLFLVSWQVQNHDGTSTTCAALGNPSVLVQSSGPGMVGAEYPCSDGEAPNQASGTWFPIGDQVVSITALDANSQTIGSAPDTDATIDYGNQLVTLPAVAITMN